jgi:CheY-like chemotaxis protein
VLVVEDNDSIRELLGFVLRSRSHDVSLAATGNEAIRLCESAESAFDVVICDGFIPGTPSEEVVDAACQRFPGVRIVVTSGAPAEWARKLEASGKLTVLEKPFSLFDLADRLQFTAEPIC